MNGEKQKTKQNENYNVVVINWLLHFLKQA
jgi:hypothetical protein